ncbi:uncharacterized protein BXZ73DRAFT_95809 [Epithele typhae]|uniref:uncharacterized protein n=1 Tax=Epithele typhae TaxID=378194 RepID=UPI00200754AE|nr:uncharacterized protein BXZ73DRAFT_95809 [Epithele typhae]KAH9946305.1 hypothetical protein BXZ73DRAFT_95809 [Epithele typhae]
MFTTAFTLALLPLVAVASPQIYGNPGPAQTTSAAAAPSAPPSTSSQINVNVAAGGQFVYDQTNISAPNGTLITFFFPGGSIPHSVTQGDFNNPCQPLQGGFDSGLQSAGVQFTLNVTNDQEPVYFFCKSPTHCGLGMVGYAMARTLPAINAPTSGNTAQAWQSAAVKVGSSEKTIQDNGFVSGGVGAIATAAPTSSSGSTGGSSAALSLGVSGALGALALAGATSVMMLFA